MAKPLRKMNNTAHELLDKYFKVLLRQGEFPEIDFKETQDNSPFKSTFRTMFG